MKIAYFDIINGISGNMILGALLDAGLDIDYLKKELSKLDLDSYDLEIKKTSKNHITGTLLNINIDLKKQSCRKFSDIKKIINKSALTDKIKNRSLIIFKKLANAEAMIHNTQPEDIHFHEVGAVDSIIDIVGAVIGLDYFNLDKIYSSSVVNGSGGLISSSHGKLPNPAPATLEILKNIPCKFVNIEEELTTPTGASILTCMADEFGPMPEMNVKQIGYGAGNKNFKESPNVLRLVIGEVGNVDVESDSISVIETNIDNMNPEYYDWIIDEILTCGALDVFLTPIIMKKSRSAICLTVLAPINLEKIIIEFILKNTSTFGVRISNLRREKLMRKQDIMKIKYGSIGIKIGYFENKIIKVSPEYEDVKKLASINKVSPQEIVNEVIKNIDKI